jgi:hypothetical protein
MDEVTTIETDIRRSPMTAARPRGDKVRALFEPLLVHQRIVRQIVEHRLGGWLSIALLDLRNPKMIRDSALARHQRLPVRDKLHTWDDELCHAVDGRTDEKTLTILLAIMFDGFPRGTVPNINSYVEVALLVMGDHTLSADIFAAAIVRVWRKNRFPPSVSQLLDACEEARQTTTNARHVVSKMLTLLDNAEEALMATGGFNET